MGKPADTSPVLSIFTFRAQQLVRATLAGELDITSAGCLRAWAGQIAGEPVTAVQLDVSGLQFVDVAGLRALVGACELLKQHCGVAELTGISPALSRLAELTCTELHGI